MEVVYLIFFFILGSVLGSFYNVLGTRIPVGKSIIKPGSHCEKCGHTLKWYELIPIISFIMLKGKCKNCKTKISWLCLFSEIFCGLLFMISYYSFGFTYNLIIAITISSTMIVVTVSDLSYMLISDRFIVIPSIIILLTKLIFMGFKDFSFSLISGILCFVIMYLIMIFGEYLFKKESLGGADVKLMFLIGITLEPLLALMVLILASVIALPVSLLLLLKNKESVIPFGPFLVVGMLIIYFTKLSTTGIIEILLGK